MWLDIPACPLLSLLLLLIMPGVLFQLSPSLLLSPNRICWQKSLCSREGTALLSHITGCTLLFLLTLSYSFSVNLKAGDATQKKVREARSECCSAPWAECLGLLSHLRKEKKTTKKAKPKTHSEHLMNNIISLPNNGFSTHQLVKYFQ